MVMVNHTVPNSHLLGVWGIDEEITIKYINSKLIKDDLYLVLGQLSFHL